MTLVSAMKRMTILAAATLALSLGAMAPSAHAVLGDLEITQFAAEPLPSALAPDPLQAAAHPNTRLYIRFCGPENNTQNHGCTTSQSQARLRDLIFRLPPGMLGNPTVVPKCPRDLFLAF